MNKVFLAGTISKGFQDAPAIDVKPYGDNKELITFRISTYEGKSKDGKSLYTYHTIKSWNTPWLKERLHAGQFVVVEGRVSIDTFEGKDGNKRTAYSVNADRVETPLEPRESAPAAAPATSTPAPQKSESDFPF